MENTINAQKDSQDKEVSLHSLSKDREILGDNDLDDSELNSKRLVRRVNPQDTFTLNFKQLKRSNSCIKDFLLRSFRVLDNRIPKHMVTLDEKYLRRCLELIHISASKASPCNISVNLRSTKVGDLSDCSNPYEIRGENAWDSARFVFECPLADDTGSVVISPAAGQWIVGSIMGSKSMVNILKSPLLRKLGALEDDANFKGMSLNDVSKLSDYSLQKLGKETPILQNHKYGSETVHKRLVSVSSTNSTCSDQSSSTSASATVTRGVLQCIWKGGAPHFVFSVDDQREAYVANLRKIDSADDKALDYMYLFHSRKDDQKEHEIHDDESHLVGKMKVSTSFTVCPNNSKIMEREFVLFGGNEKFVGEMQSGSHNLRKNKGLSKVVKVLRTGHSSKQRSISKFSGSSAILENYSWDPSQAAGNNSDVLGGSNLLDNQIPPNLELAAIIVKEHLPDDRQEKVGGWGLKFLKKVGVKQTTPEASVPSACCVQDTGNCSTSMDILVPAGLHGGPRAMNGGPSSLIDRWRSGGLCDCGGWDLGCPLSVLKTKEETFPEADMQECCRFIDLFVKGSEHGAPILRMVNVRDGLYFIHFQSTLSALQSFSIAVAYIHTQSSTLRPKNVQEVN